MELLAAWATLFLAAVVLSAVVHFLITFLSRGHRTYNLPPGPKPWPIIGNLNLIGELPHCSIHELSKRYGALMQLRLGSVPVVFGTSAEMAKIFLKTKDEAFSDRPRLAISKHSSYNYSSILWSPYGPHHRQARRICTAELFSAKRLESLEHIRDEEVRVMLRDLRESSGRTVRLRDCLQMLTLGVISRILLGKKYLVEEEGASPPPAIMPAEFREAVDEFFELHGAFNIGDFIPWLEWLDLQGCVRRVKRMSATFDSFLEHVLDEHNERRRLEGDRFVAKDMVDVLLQLADGPNHEVQLSRDSVKAITQDLIIGATDTAANTVEWAVSELLKNPEILAKATDELNHVVGLDRLVTEGDIPHLPYLEAILKETMRLHPGAPMLAPHLSREDVSVDGYHIPAGTTVFVNVWSIGRDPAHWDAPQEFRPQRFLGSKVDVRGQDFELLPFGSGRRMCPAYNLALKVMALSLANLLHGFVWRLPDGVTAEELSMEETYRLTLPRKVPLEAVVEPRLPARLYMGA